MRNQKKETAVGKYLFNSDGLCTNPTVILSHTGSKFEYHLQIAQGPAGWLNGWVLKVHGSGPGTGGSTLNIFLKNGTVYASEKIACIEAASAALDFFGADNNHRELTMLRAYLASKAPVYDAGIKARKIKPEPPLDLNKALEELLSSSMIPENINELIHARYSDEELEDFKVNVDRKLETAKKESVYLKGLIENPKRDFSEAEQEQLKQMLSRQETYINHLEQALTRIKDKTYGICRTTGKLIDKARLRAVPHATLSMEAKTGDYLNSSQNQNTQMPKTTIAPVPEPEVKFEMIPLKNIVPDPNQPRKFFDEQAQDELTNSIREKGVLQPIMVRPYGKKFMIVCGERRYNSSTAVMAAFKHRDVIPAIIRNISDDEALELQIIENLQRKDVHPMEEAVAFKSLVDHGHDLKEIAAKIGKSDFYARQRLKLNALTENWQKAYFKNRLSNTTALTVAMFEPKVQDALFEDQNDTGMIELSRWELQKYRGDLSEAAFDLTDPTLDKKMGACTNCQFNSATASLFELEGPAKCSNFTCFKGKTDNHFIRAFEESKQDATMIFVHDSYSSSSDKFVQKLIKEGIPVHSKNDYRSIDPPFLSDFGEWKEEAADDYEDQSEENLKRQYQEDEVKLYEKELKDYQAAIDSGKYKKAFMLTGDTKGKFVWIIMNKSASTKSAKVKVAAGSDELTAEDITAEIERINGREKRNQELDMEKVHVAMLEDLKKAEDLKKPGLAMQEIDRGILVYMLLKEGGYDFPKKMEKLCGLPAMPDSYRNKYKFTPEYFIKLSQVTDTQLAFILRLLAMENYGTKNMGMGVHFDDTIPRLMAEYMGVDIKKLEAYQRTISVARYEKVRTKINKLQQQRNELKPKKAAAKKSTK